MPELCLRLHTAVLLEEKVILFHLILRERLNVHGYCQTWMDVNTVYESKGKVHNLCGYRATCEGVP